MEPGNISGWAPADIRESLEVARVKGDESQSEYVVESVRQRLEREQMLPHQRRTPSPLELLIEEARATGEILGSEVEVAIKALRAVRAKHARNTSARRREGAVV